MLSFPTKIKKIRSDPHRQHSPDPRFLQLLSPGQSQCLGNTPGHSCGLEGWGKVGGPIQIDVPKSESSPTGGFGTSLPSGKTTQTWERQRSQVIRRGRNDGKGAGRWTQKGWSLPKTHVVHTMSSLRPDSIFIKFFQVTKIFYIQTSHPVARYRKEWF